MRILIPAMIVAALALTACEKKPKTFGEKVGAAAEKAGDKVEKAGDEVKDATN